MQSTEKRNAHWATLRANCEAELKAIKLKVVNKARATRAQKVLKVIAKKTK